MLDLPDMYAVEDQLKSKGVTMKATSMEGFYVLNPENVPVLLAALYAATKTLIDTYAQMLDAGKVTDLEQLLTFDQFNALVGMEEKLQYEEKYGRGEGQEKLHVKVPGLSRPI